jgi:arylsulfatase A-like enzyme
MPHSTSRPAGVESAADPQAALPATPPRLLLAFATVWIAALVIRTVMFWIVTGSPLPAPALRWYEQAGLLCLRFVSLVPATLVFAGCFTGMYAASRLPARSAKLVRAACWAAVFCLAFATYGSWAGFYTTGQFMGSEALSLAMASPMLIIDHVVEIAPLFLVVVPVLSLVVVVGYARLCRWTAAWPAARARRLVTGVAAALVLSVGGAYAADVAATHDTHLVASGGGGTLESPHDMYASVGMDRSGPIARLLVDAFHAATLTTLRAVRWAGTGEGGHRVITAAAYADEVAPGKAPRLNVILVLVESLRKDELMAEGGRRDVMPALEALAREGTVYTDVVAPAAQSDYATTSVLASQFPLRSITYHPFVPHLPYLRVLPYDILKAFGYRTGVFSSQNEYWSGMYYFIHTDGVEHFLHAETFNGATFAANSDRGLREWMDKTGHAGKIDDRQTIDEAIAWIDSIAPHAPFFTYINLQSSHNPYIVPRTFAPRFGSGHVSFPILFDVFPADSAQAVRDLYDNSLAYADVQLGRLFDALKKDGRWDSTVVAVLGDHGEAFYEHGFGAHASQLYDEVTHVPLVIRVPSRRPGRDSLPASSIDVMPTILGVLNLPPHPAYQGVDLANAAGRADRPLFSLTQTAMADEVSVEQDHWKLLFDLRHSLTRLYDLRNDPGETRDVAAQFPEQRDALMGTMAAWWARQIDYYAKLPAQPQFYAPSPPVAVPLEPPPARIKVVPQ